MFGPCKCCAEKDVRISDLKQSAAQPCRACPEKQALVASLRSEIEYLREQLRPKIPKNSHRASVEQLEADALIGGQTDQIIIDEQSRFIENPLPRLSAEELAAVAERDAILSGNY
jgi:hypothetical protein